MCLNYISAEISFKCKISITALIKIWTKILLQNKEFFLTELGRIWKEKAAFKYKQLTL